MWRIFKYLNVENLPTFQIYMLNVEYKYQGTKKLFSALVCAPKIFYEENK